MNSFKPNRITKDDFLNINEDDVMFVTNPGRMCDEDGSTFVLKNDNEFLVYRISGWMYPSSEDKISKSDKKTLKYAAIYNVWYQAFVQMANDKKMLVK